MSGRSKDRARMVCTRCHDRKVKCDLQEQPGGRCRNCQRDGHECRQRFGTRKRLNTSKEVPCSTDSTALRDNSPGQDQPNPQGATNQPSPVSTSTPSQRQSGYIGDLSVLSMPADLEPTFSPHISPLPGDISEAVLRLTKATSTPPPPLANALIDIYFEKLYPLIPVVDRSEIIGQTAPIILLQAVYFAGGLMRRSKHWPDASSPENCYKKIKTLLFLNHEADKMIVLKAFCLLSVWSPTVPTMITLDCPWQWTGVAIRLAMQFGMHREKTYTNDPEKRYNRMIWWFLFCNETLQSTCYGRPPMIRQQDFDVKLPPLAISGLNNSETQSSIQLPRLLLNMSNIEILNSQRRQVLSTELQPIIASLRRWIEELPKGFQLYDEYSKRNPYNRFVSEVHIHYFACLILLYLLPGSHRHSQIFCAASIVASSCMVRLYEEILYHEDITFLLPSHGWMNLVAAVPQIYCLVKFPVEKASCNQELDILVSILTELRIKYPSAGVVIRQIARFRQTGTTFSGLDDPIVNANHFQSSEDLGIQVADINTLFPFPDCISPKISLLQPRLPLDVMNNTSASNYMSFNIDEMTWTFDWLSSSMGDSENFNTDL